MSKTATQVKTLADIIVFRGVPVTYTYEVPEEKQSHIKVGDHVTVPLGKSSCKGMVLKLSQSEDENPRIKALLDIDENSEAIDAELIHLIKGFIDFYQCTPYKAYQSVIGNRKYRPQDPPNEESELTAPFVLNDEQQQAFDAVMAEHHYSEHLIHGITGSGKTEIYLQLSAEMLKQGKSIIVCCPEISLTPQYTRHFTERFGNKVSVIHSNLTPKQRDIAWSNIKDGHTPIIIGPRSSVFSPSKNLGMIIIDEEHDSSYKQESHPRYHTHRVARWRCRSNDCPLVLGSATPSITSYMTCKENKDAALHRSYSELTKRATGSSLPSVELIDLSESKPSKHLFLSQQFVDAIQERLDRKEKVLLLLNRRGFAPYIVCQRCKKVHTCPSCDLSYTYHQDKTFRCHRCDVTLLFNHQCNHCNKPGLAFQGTGIQKIETACQDLFNGAHISRLDKDTAKTAKQMEAILDEFKAKGDILIGTQLISKGHHIEDITFVGVLGIDTTLNMPDFSSAESSFQLLMQVSGRAGRGSKAGHVLIQTLQPDHYAIEAAQAQNYAQFIEKEAQFRKQLNYPPYSSITHVIMSATDKKALQAYCATLKRHLDTNKTSDVQVLGPKPAPFEKIRLHWRYHLLIKHNEAQNDAVATLIKAFPKAPKDIRVIIDKDPLQLL